MKQDSLMLYDADFEAYPLHLIDRPTVHIGDHSMATVRALVGVTCLVTLRLDERTIEVSAYRSGESTRTIASLEVGCWYEVRSVAWFENGTSRALGPLYLCVNPVVLYPLDPILIDATPLVEPTVRPPAPPLPPLPNHDPPPLVAPNARLRVSLYRREPEPFVVCGFELGSQTKWRVGRAWNNDIVARGVGFEVRRYEAWFHYEREAWRFSTLDDRNAHLVVVDDTLNVSCSRGHVLEHPALILLGPNMFFFVPPEEAPRSHHRRIEALRAALSQRPSAAAEREVLAELVWWPEDAEPEVGLEYVRRALKAWPDVHTKALGRLYAALV